MCLYEREAKDDDDDEKKTTYHTGLNPSFYTYKTAKQSHIPP